MSIHKPVGIWRYVSPVRADLSAAYTRKLHKWLIIAPLVGLFSGLLVTAVVLVILHGMWPRVQSVFLAHHWTMVPGITLGCALTGMLMQYLTPDANEHSTEEVIRSYHEHDGAMDLRTLPVKLAASALTVGMGGSGALEGPAIYSGASIGSRLWSLLRHVRRFHLDARDRRILLICGAAAGMSAVFRAPLTGIVFALEMPYKDDLAHEALLPSLLASVVSYMTLGTFIGERPLFDFRSTGTFSMRDLLWSAVLGLLTGLVAMAFVITFRRVRRLVVRAPGQHWVKVAIGGFLTALVGLLFLQIYPGVLVPVGPNYEAVGMVVNQYHTSVELVLFMIFKLLATLCTVGSGAVSAMFVPMFLSGGSLGMAFGQSIVHSGSPDLYAAVGMAAFIAAAYKTPLAAVVFVAEATGGHAFIIPALVGSAVAYAVSGDASTSADQRVDASRSSRISKSSTP